jgi:hypothetical protein
MRLYAGTTKSLIDDTTYNRIAGKPKRKLAAANLYHKPLQTREPRDR